LSTFGGEEGKTCQSYTVNNKAELEQLLDDPAFNAADKMQLVEVTMDQFDAPRALKVQAELSGKANKVRCVSPSWGETGAHAARSTPSKMCLPVPS
jgi:TPP-dependent 2-oxoacid decarboxylase